MGDILNIRKDDFCSGGYVDVRDPVKKGNDSE